MKILFAGEGGQGVQAVAQILAAAAFKENKNTLYIPNFGVEQRGGNSLAFVVIDENPVVYPKFRHADILAILADRTIKRVTDYIGPKTKIILGPAVTQKLKAKSSKLKAGNHPPRVWNVLVMGKVNQFGKLVGQKTLVAAMDERFARSFKKEPKLRQFNLKALGL